MEQDILNYHTLIFGNWIDDNNIKYDFSYITQGLEGTVTVDDGVNPVVGNYSITKSGNRMYLIIGITEYEIEDLSEATLKGKGPAPGWPVFYLNKIANEPPVATGNT